VKNIIYLSSIVFSIHYLYMIDFELKLIFNYNNVTDLIIIIKSYLDGRRKVCIICVAHMHCIICMAHENHHSNYFVSFFEMGVPCLCSEVEYSILIVFDHHAFFFSSKND